MPVFARGLSSRPSFVVWWVSNPSAPASSCQSFYFYIPHERLRPGGHLLSIFLSTPSLDTYFGRVCCFAYHQVIILNFHKLFCETFSNRTARVSSRTVVTVRRRQLSLLLGYIRSDNFHPFIYSVGPPKSPDEGLSYSYLIHHSMVGQILCCDSCFVILFLCIVEQHVEYGIILRFLRLTRFYGHPFSRRFSMAKGLDTNALSSYCKLFSIQYVYNAAFHPTFWVSHLLRRLTYSRIKLYYFAPS